MEWIDSQWLALIGAIALGVYLYCSFAEQREAKKDAPQRMRRRESRQDTRVAEREKSADEGWRRLALAETLKNVCAAGIESDRVYVFINNEQHECRWSCNAFRLDGEKELCTIEPGGTAKLMRHLLQHGTLIDMADAILEGYVKKHGRI